MYITEIIDCDEPIKKRRREMYMLLDENYIRNCAYHGIADVMRVNIYSVGASLLQPNVAPCKMLS